MNCQKELFILTPFEVLDTNLILETLKTESFPILHLGRDESEARKKLKLLSEQTTKLFGVCLVEENKIDKLPHCVTKVFYPFGMDVVFEKNIEPYCQVCSVEEAEEAVKIGIKNIVLKGNEGAGKVSDETSYILFQRAMSNLSLSKSNLYIQGGVGVHNSAAVLALGAKGVIMDSQITLFPECSIPSELKEVCKKLSGSETKVIDNFRVLTRNNSPKLPVSAQYHDIKGFLGKLDFAANYIPMGQDISLSIDLVEKYKTLKNLVDGFHQTLYGHLQQAKNNPIIKPDNPLAKSIGIKYPIAQGPMARVSDVPKFAKDVADAGALPFISMSLSTGNGAEKLLNETKKLLETKPWGVGILGFIPSQLREEQTKYILEAKPPVVLIAGGRPSIAKLFEKEGIKTFLHVSSPLLLDMFTKEGARNFIFEGRECGGHLGALSSFVLWERQINRLLKKDNLSKYSLFFAGGIHDALSSAFITVMTTTLAAKGAKIGVLMGSAYLYTKEAVNSGAIVPEYQKQALKGNKTVVLEAAPGQETRSVQSPYTAFFEKEKKRLQSECSDSTEVWMKLEELNIGRLRIAAKGVERKGSEIVKLTEEEQTEKGLFMIGQIAALHNKVITIDKLHKAVAVDSCKLLSKVEEISLPKFSNKPIDIAIVGMAGIFPGARTLEEYWRNIILGKDCITEVPDERWNKELYYDPNTQDTDYTCSKWGGFLPRVDFNPLEFGMTPQSLASIESSQLLSLLVAKQALADAGYVDLAKVNLENTSVIFGAEGATELAASYGIRSAFKQLFGELPKEYKDVLPKLNKDSFPGVLPNVIAGRIANRLNLGGRSFTIDAACASSLAALDMACKELVTNSSDMAIVGGADLHNGIGDYLMFSSTYALSKKGVSASFDADADGIVLGEGIGAIIIKRLDDAIRDGNKIYSVIRGVGGSSDGKSLGMTAPNRVGQFKAFQRAYASAGILPSEVGMIEAHGTGTVVGDKTELGSLTDVFLESGAVRGQTLLSSVKTQIGHAKCAAGIAGVIKTALSVYHGVQPSILHLKKPNASYDKENSPFVFNTQTGIWNSEKRIAGVCAFGFGGTNFHVVMENHEQQGLECATSMPLWPSELFLFRGDSFAEAEKMMRNIKELIGYNDTINIKNIAYSLAVYNNKDVQVSIVASDATELLNKIETALIRGKESGVYYPNKIEGKVAFLFSGQGSQRVNMARDLFVAFPQMRKLLNRHKEYEKYLFPYAAFDDQSRKEQEVLLTDTRNAQPLLGIVDFAIADYLRSLGIVPDMLAGHSYGELPALCFSGVFEPENLVPLSRDRALSILNAIEEDKGKMIAVNLPETQLTELLTGEKDVWIVNYNSQKQMVLAGTTAGITALMTRLTQEGIGYKELNVACAFHSPLLNKSKELYSEILSNVDFKEPTIPVWSNTTANLYPNEESNIKQRLAEHLIKPVLFTKQVENMYADGARIFIETGPGRVLSGLVQTTLGDKVTTIETDSKSSNGVTFLLNAIAKYISTGKIVDVCKLFEQRNAIIIDIDQPEKFKRESTIWCVNGQNAIPANGVMPSHGAYPITKPIGFPKRGTTIDMNQEKISDQTLLLEYLNSVGTMLQAQRDVMLGYWGINPPPMQHTTSQIISQNVQQSAGVIKQPVTEIPTNASESKATVAPTPELTIERIKSVLLEVVSDNTGYPVEMLGLDLDMEGDLSIDSIKRMEIIGELKERLNIKGGLENAEDALEKMAGIKTLNSLISWIEELVENKPQAAVSVKQESTIALTSQASELTIDQIKEVLLNIVSENTGYPVEMLGLDLDLEGELSIDSIKRMEIIGALKEKLNIKGGFEDADDALEKMAGIKTLNSLIAWIEEMMCVNNQKPEKDDNNILRMNFELEEKPIKKSSLAIDGKKIALAVDSKSELITPIKEMLETEGALVNLVSTNSELSQYDGLIVLNSSNVTSNFTIMDLFTLLKHADLKNLKWIYTFSDILGDTAKDNPSKIKEIQGFSGFIKTLLREFPDKNIRSLVFHTAFDKQTLPKIVLDELSVSDPIHIEIVYKDNKRYFNSPKIQNLSFDESVSRLHLENDSVMIVFGGAQGITPRLLEELAKEYPCNYILVGRTENPNDEIDKYRSLKTKDDIRKYLITKEEMRSPAEIEKKLQRIYKVNQIATTLDLLQKQGAKVVYKSLDIRNEKELRMFIKGVYETYGRIDGVLHAAGVLDDKLFVQKTEESFAQVYNTKVIPLRVLLDELQSDLKLLVLFSSASSSFGNKGQSDYSAANSVFDLATDYLKDSIATRILTVNWGPWKGTGMVSDSLEKEFKKRGVSLLPLDAGASYFVNELKYGRSNRVLVMGGTEQEAMNFIGSVEE